MRYVPADADLLLVGLLVGVLNGPAEHAPVGEFPFSGHAEACPEDGPAGSEQAPSGSSPADKQGREDRIAIVAPGPEVMQEALVVLHLVQRLEAVLQDIARAVVDGADGVTDTAQDAVQKPFVVLGDVLV